MESRLNMLIWESLGLDRIIATIPLHQVQKGQIKESYTEGNNKSVKAS